VINMSGKKTTPVVDRLQTLEEKVTAAIRHRITPTIPQKSGEG
jgi:hypothetical protein